VEAASKSRVSPLAKRVAAAQNIDLGAVVGTGPDGRILRRDVEIQPTEQPGKVRATPAARRLAREQQLDLSLLNGSGPKGRVQAADVFAQAVQPASGANGAQQIPLAGIRQRIAQRVQQSYQTAPHIFVEMPVDMSQIEAQRQTIKAEGDALSLTAVLVMACAWALQRHPKLNATLADDTTTLHRAAHIGIAVALDEGLIVPVLHDAQALSLAAIQSRSSDLITRARAGRLQPAEVAGGTFTISNLGMFGVSRFTAIINPPQVAILAVGRINKQFVPDEHEQPVLRPLMNLVLSVDHRVIDGADAARFLDDLRRVLEQPLRLLW
jgi:pyruvate dehydrogenase E2 component (dihydrolipoamide acetyltransferase)